MLEQPWPPGHHTVGSDHGHALEWPWPPGHHMVGGDHGHRLEWPWPPRTSYGWW